MSRRHQIAILSDIHYAGAAEQARGNDFEFRGMKNPLLRLAVRTHRRFIWLRNPLNQNHLLDEFIRRAGSTDLVVANGDYSCNSAFVGVSDDAALESARECLEKLRAKFAPNFQASIGDHELGKISFVGGRGGMRLASWKRATRELGLQPLWRVGGGEFFFFGVGVVSAGGAAVVGVELRWWQEGGAGSWEAAIQASAVSIIGGDRVAEGWRVLHRGTGWRRP